MMNEKWLMASVIAIALGVGGQAFGGAPESTDPCRPRLLQRFRPAGGWHPDEGGLLHWWNPHCQPRVCGPNDYCRKPPPNLCWPPYPPYYTWGPPGGGPP